MTTTAEPPIINERGPRCEWCGKSPDDPLWVQPRDVDKGLACLGCVADLRAYGQRVRILARALFTVGA